MKKYFSEQGTLLQIHRGINHMSLLDVYVKYLKTRMISYLKIHPQKNFPDVLNKAVTSYNQTHQKLLQGSPACLNSNFFDPILRACLHKHHPKLLPFDQWYKQQLVLQKKFLTPRKGPPKSRDDFRVNELVMLQHYPIVSDLKRRNWSRRIKKDLYRIERVDTRQKPFRRCNAQEICISS